MKPVNSKLAQKLVALRGEQSLYKVGEGSGVNRGSLLRYEAGEKIPEDPNLKKLARFYQVDFAELKKLILEDMFPVKSENRKILLEWVSELSNQ